jgi:large subunit ribosomal protein L18
MLAKIQNRIKRHTRIRARISGTAARPRLSVYRSNTSIFVQLIDDEAGKTLASASCHGLTTGTKTAKAGEVGKLIAEAGKKVGITTAVFDRGGFLYAGRVKALAEGARSTGLSF